MIQCICKLKKLKKQKERGINMREKIMREINECAKTGDSHVCYIKLSDVESFI